MFFAISSPTAQSCTMVSFAWYWTRSDTFRLREDVPQNRLRNGRAVVEVSNFYTHVFCHKPPTAQLCTMVCLLWSWTRSDTFALPEDTPQNRLRNGWAVVEVCGLVLCVFCHKLTNCSVTYYGPFCIISDSLGYRRTPWRRSTKRSSHCRGKWTCISCYLPYAYQLLSHIPWTILHNLGLVLIPPYSVKMLHKTVYEMVWLLWR